MARVKDKAQRVHIRIPDDSETMQTCLEHGMYSVTTWNKRGYAKTLKTRSHFLANGLLRVTFKWERDSSQDRVLLKACGLA